MSKIIFYDELSEQAKKYATCLVTMKEAIKSKKPLLSKNLTRGAVSKFQALIPELQTVVEAIEKDQYFPSFTVDQIEDSKSSPKNKNVLEFSFASDYSVCPQKFWWSPTSPVHTVMFAEIDDPLTIVADESDMKSDHTL